MGHPLGTLLRRVDTRAAVVAGLLGGAAYIVEMEIDLPLFGYNADDLRLLGRPFAPDPSLNRAVGAAIHMGNSAMFGVAYAALAHDRLPGPPWLRGVVFANVENAALYPLTLLDGYHPGVRDGQIDRYWHRTAFTQAVLRHVVFGAVLGAVYGKLHRRRG